MPLYTLHTYYDIKELRKLQQDTEVFPFEFEGTKTLLKSDPCIYIDISTLIYFLEINRSNLYPALINLQEMTDETTVIVKESLADEALAFFPLQFSHHKPLYESQEKAKDESIIINKKCLRQPIYTYNNNNDLTAIITYANEKNIPIATFARASSNMREEFELFNKSAELALLDLTSVSYAIEDNKSLIYLIEQFLNLFQNIKVIALTSQIDNIIKYFPLFIENQVPIRHLLPDLGIFDSIDDPTDDVKKVTMLSPSDFDIFIRDFNYNLIGHNYFKERFAHLLRNFIALNRVKEQKVLSIFLFGASGIGKTEVARLVANGLLEDCYLAKINFQNYSSQDALNSLIGSPAGYVGCNHGELSDKVQKSKVGIVLCDEFEKATRPVFSFFLELLEEGRFTDSMAREYDLNGYILIFTSNLRNKSEYEKTIPPELQTRFDLACEFQVPSTAERREFLKLLYEQAKRKFAGQFSQVHITQAEERKLLDFDCSNISALRDIKKLFNSRLMDLFTSKGLHQ